jgi:teichuronic acid biosynthesis glycosyltransferase TuaG
MENTLVSIITPTYNSAKYIVETIQSVQNQTYTNWEMIIVDDKSSDNTTEIVAQFAKTDSRIKTFLMPTNSGPAKARNLGIENVTGKYMTFLDADDIWFPDFIENSINTINKTGIHFVFSSYKRSNEKLEFVYSDFIVPEKVSYTDILKSNSISCLTAFLDIQKLGKKAMPDIFKRQDMGLWLQYLKEIPYAYGIQEPKAIYRIRENSLSRNKSKLIKYQWQFYREVENLSILQSIFYMTHWAIRGFLKYRNSN